MKNKLYFAICAVFLAVALVASISAAGIVSPYWKDYPLTMNYGETKIVNFELQNMVGDKDITVEVVLKQGGDIASLEKTTYTAKVHTSDTVIPLTIVVPEDYSKSFQKIEMDVKTVNEDTGGMVTLGTGWTTSFNVIFEEQESGTSFTWIVLGLILVVLILGIVIFVLIRRRR